MGRLLETIESPVLTDVKLTFEGVEAAEVYPHRVPDLFLRQPLLLYGRVSRGQAGRVRLTARAGDNPYEASFAFDASTATFHAGITTLWARQRVEDLMDRWRVSDEDSRPEIRSALIAHAIRYRLVTRFTSLVAVEEVVANTGGASARFRAHGASGWDAIGQSFLARPRLARLTPFWKLSELCYSSWATRFGC